VAETAGLGVFPLVVARGAGELRWSLGITVFAGMIGVTLFGVFLTPVFYYVLERLGDGLRKPPGERVGNDTIASA